MSRVMKDLNGFALGEREEALLQHILNSVFDDYPQLGDYDGLTMKIVAHAEVNHQPGRIDVEFNVKGKTLGCANCVYDYANYSRSMSDEQRRNAPVRLTYVDSALLASV